MGRARLELHPVMREAATALGRLFPGTVTSTFRSVAEQAQLYRNRARNPYPVNPPGTSAHHTGLAFDYVVREGPRSEAQLAAGRAWRAAGGEWRETDVVHFQHPATREALRLGLVSRRWWAGM